MHEFKSIVFTEIKKLKSFAKKCLDLDLEVAHLIRLVSTYNQ